MAQIRQLARRSGSIVSRGAITITLLLAQPPVGHSAEPLSGDVRIDSAPTTPKIWPAACNSDDGDVVVVWASLEQDGSGLGVFGQRLDRSGVLQGSEFQVNTYTSRSQTYPHVCCHADGGFVVAWEEDGRFEEPDSGIAARRFDSAGLPLGNQLHVNTTTERVQRKPAVACLDGETFVVVWDGIVKPVDSFPRAWVFGQRYSADGQMVGTEFRVNTSEGTAKIPDVAASVGGSEFVVVWQDYGLDGSDAGVSAQIYSDDGTPSGENFQVNTYTTGDQVLAQISTNRAGEFVVAWRSNDYLFGIPQDGSHAGAFAQRFGPDGARMGPELQANIYTTDHQTRPSVKAVGAGFVIAWESLAVISGGQDGSSDGVFGRTIAATRSVSSDEFRINDYTTGSQALVEIVEQPDGEFLAVWMHQPEGVNTRGVFVRRFVEPSLICGDANADDKISAVDALLALQAAVGIAGCDACRCDTDGQNGTSATDALGVLLSAVGQPQQFDCPTCSL